MAVYLNIKTKASLFSFMRKLAVIASISVIISGCETTPKPNRQVYTPPTGEMPAPRPTPSTPGTQDPNTPKEPSTTTPKEPTGPVTLTRDGLTPPFMDPKGMKRVAIILPFSARSARLRAEAGSMLMAAELALFSREEKDILLIALDSGGTPDGARTAAQTAIAQGADVILGPITAKAVTASARAARKSRTPIIAFSNDTSIAGTGVYLLSFPPEAEVARVTEFAAQSGARKFAYIGPDSVYGRRVLGAYKQQVEQSGGIINGVETYRGKDISVMQDPARRLASFYSAAKEGPVDPQSRELAITSEEAAFHAVMLPEGGVALRSLAPLLSFYNEDVRSSNVQFMGTGLWNREDAAREPALNGGIFAGPDLEGKAAFTAQYDAMYGEEPSRLATLAFDGLNIAAFVADGKPNERTARIIDPAGFFGVDGLVQFGTDGAPERGLAIYQIRNGRFVVIDEAPRSTDSAF